MSGISLDQIKKLRLQTKSGVMDCRKALEQSGGNLQEAKKWLRKKGIVNAVKRVNRETAEGLLETYTHSDGRVVGVVELLCETDFVARTADFKHLAHELAMQTAAMDPKKADRLLQQAYIRDPKITVGDLVKEAGSRMGENIRIGRIARFELGESKKIKK